MDCKHARLLLEIAHPLTRELGARETEALAGHLADCPECGPWAEAERQIDEKIGSAMRDVPVPGGAQQRLLRRLHVERDAYYRRWFVRAAGVAAMILVTCLAAYFVWFGRKPVPDLQALSYEVNVIASSPELVEQAFAERGVAMTAPTKFEYANLRDFGLADFQGRQVPFLLFQVGPAKGNPPALAKVYVLTSRQFDVDGIEMQLVPQGSRLAVVVQTDPVHLHVAYVVVYTASTDLSRFYKAPGKWN